VNNSRHSRVADGNKGSFMNQDGHARAGNFDFWDFLKF